MKFLPALALGLTTLFLVTACGEKPSQDAASNSQAVAPARRVESPLDDARFIRATLPVTTKDGRSLSVAFTAYCEKLADLDNETDNKTGKNETAYARACIAYVQKSLNYAATGYDFTGFEGVIPAVSSAVRNATAPQKADGSDAYPANYSVFSEDTMRATLGMKPDDNLYTVTGIAPVPPP